MPVLADNEKHKQICRFLKSQVALGSCYKMLINIQVQINLPLLPDFILALVTILSFLLLGAQDPLLLALSAFCLPSFLWMLHHYYFKFKSHTTFYYSCALVSFVFIIFIFEFEVVPFMEILVHENLIMASLVMLAFYLAYKVQNNPGFITSSLEHSSNDTRLIYSCHVCQLIPPPESSHCKICEKCIYGKDFHCQWLNTCIGAYNRKHFVLLLLTLLLASIYNASLTLTTICHPKYLFSNFLLFPDDCSEVYHDIHLSISFVSALYSLALGALIFGITCHQVWKIFFGNVITIDSQKGRGFSYCPSKLLGFFSL